MARYIPKDALVAEIDRTQKRLNTDDIGGLSVMAWSEGFKNFIDTLEVKEVDLEKDVRQIIDLYLEAGKYYDDVIKKERNMYGYSDLAIKLLDRTADAKEMSVQYVLDKLKAQKGE